MIRIVDLEGNVIDRELTAAEIKQNEKDQAILAAENAALAAKLESKKSAMAKLAALGLTEDEIAAL